MVGSILLGFLVFTVTVVLFKILFFALGVLFKGAGFIIKTLVLFIIVTPMVILILLLAGSLISYSSLIYIILGGFVLSIIIEGDRRSRIS